MYRQRAEVLEGADIRQKVSSMIDDYVEEACNTFLVGDSMEEWNLDGLRGYFYGILTTDEDFIYTEKDINKVSAESIYEDLLSRARAKYEEKESLFPEGALREIERIVLLRNVDRHWIDHIDAMDDLEDGIGLRAYGQQDPFKEYRLIAGDMFDEMTHSIKEQTAKTLLTVMPANIIRHAEAPKATSEGQKQMPSPTAAPTQRENVYGSAAKPEKQSTEPYVKSKSEQVGRNDPCPCGSGLKYKKCCMLKNEDSQNQ